MPAVYDVWHHLRFRPSTCKLWTGVLKNIHSRDRFWKPALLVNETTFTCGRKTKTEETTLKKYTNTGNGATVTWEAGENPLGWIQNHKSGKHGIGKNVPHRPMSSEYLYTYLVSTCIAALNTCDGGNLTSQREINSQSGILHINEITTWVSCEYCWIARDVTSAMLVAKNKSISLLWELNSIFR